MIPEFWKYIKHFKPAEFDSPDFKSTGAKMNEKLIRILDIIRIVLNRAMHINSGFRTPAYNTEVGGVGDSAHLSGDAVDIRCETSADRWLIVSLAIKFGIKRIGIGKSFVHLDVKSNAPQGVIWVY